MSKTQRTKFLLSVLAVLVCLTLTSLAQQSSIQTISRGQAQPSYTVATSTGAGNAFAAEAGGQGFWVWTVAYSGGPTATSANLEGSIDFQIFTDGAISASSGTFTSATASFKATDVGKEVRIAGAGASGTTLVSTISAYTNATTVTLAANASTTVSGALFNVARWFQLDNSTVSSSAPVLGSSTAEMRSVVYKPTAFIRCNLLTLTGGTSPAGTCGNLRHSCVLKTSDS